MYGSQVPIKGMGNVMADENYIRESILYPQAKIVRRLRAAVQDAAFLGQFNDRDIDAIIAFLKSNQHPLQGRP